MQCPAPRHRMCPFLYMIYRSGLCHRPATTGMRTRKLGYRPHWIFRAYQRDCASLCPASACNINGKAILASIASSPEQVHAATGIHPPSQPTRYPSTHDQLDQPGSGQNEPSQRAIKASHRSGPCRWNTCEHNTRGPSRVCVARARPCATPA